MKLFKYELKKNVIRISVLILLLSLAVVNGYKLFETVRLFGSHKSEREMSQMYYAFSGEITEESISRLAQYNSEMQAIVSSEDYKPGGEKDDRYYTGYPYGDMMYSSQLMDNVRYAVLYPNVMIELKERADANIKFYTDKNSYEVRKNELVNELYTGRRIKSLGDYTAFSLYFDYDFSSLVIIVMLIFAFSSSYTVEKSTGTDKIIRSCEKAKNVFLAKQGTLLLFAAILTILFAAMDIAGLCSVYDGTYINQPLYAIESYKYTPFNLTILGGIVVSVLVKLLVFVFIGELIMLISTFTRNTGLSITLCFALTGVLVLTSGNIPVILSPITMLNAESYLISPQFVNIFSFPVLSLFVQLFVLVIYIAVIAVICYIRTSGKKHGRRTVFNKRRIAVTATILLISVAFTACSETAKTGKLVNIYDNTENSRYIFSEHETTDEDTLPADFDVIDKQGSDSFTIPPDTFADSEEQISGFYPTEEYLYYSTGSPIESIYRIRLSDMAREKIVSAEKISQKTALGLIFTWADMENRFSAVSFFTDGNTIYLIDKNNMVFTLNPFAKTLSDCTCIIEDSISSECFFDGECIYYLNTDSRIMKYDTASADLTAVSEDKVDENSLHTDGENLIYSTGGIEKTAAI